MTTKTNIQEQLELDLLTGRGFTYTLKLPVRRVKHSYLLGLIKRYERTTEERTMTISPPTLQTMINIADVGLRMHLDEERLKSEDMRYGEQWASVLGNAEKAAQAIAIATLGATAYKPSRLGYAYDMGEVDKLASDILVGMTPKMLWDVTVALQYACGIAGFVNSIRLLKANRPTDPGRIEEASEASTDRLGR